MNLWNLFSVQSKTFTVIFLVLIPSFIIWEIVDWILRSRPGLSRKLHEFREGTLITLLTIPALVFVDTVFEGASTLMTSGVLALSFYTFAIRRLPRRAAKTSAVAPIATHREPKPAIVAREFTLSDRKTSLRSEFNDRAELEIEESWQVSIKPRKKESGRDLLE